MAEIIMGLKADIFATFPPDLSKLLEGFSFKKDHIGCSSAGVFRCERNDEVMYLKITEISDEIRCEKELLSWLKDKLPIPDIIYYNEYNGIAFLCITVADGLMACDNSIVDEDDQDKVREPVVQTVKLLADGLRLLQDVDIRNCPIEKPLENKLRTALFNIENDLVDIENFEESNEYESPSALFDWLTENKPIEELCFTHGDFCLSNIFINEKKVTGFIDLGRGGIADKWQDIALCARSLGYDIGRKQQTAQVELLFKFLGIMPDDEKIKYYILLDELF